jgi:hypothetical protein
MGERNLSTRRTLALALASASYVAYDQATGQFANASPALSGADLDAHLARAERFVAAGPGAVARTVQSKLCEYPSVTDFADPLSFDGVTDNAAAFRAAAATGQPYFVPPGLAYRLRNSVAHAFPGQYAFGSGCTATKIAIHPDFDMSALGVFTSPPSAEGAGLRDLELAFIQTDTKDRADVIAYPPAYALPRRALVRWRTRLGVRRQLRRRSGRGPPEQLP